MDYGKCCRIAASLLNAEWKFAKSQAKTNPHWYTLRYGWDDDLFCEAVFHMREVGYSMMFGWPKKEYRCWNVNHCRIWTMPVQCRPKAQVMAEDGDWSIESKQGTVLINRAQNKAGQQDYDGYETWYDNVMSGDDWDGPCKEFAEFASEASGEALDIGTGTGASFDLQICDPSHTTVCEPSAGMVQRAMVKHKIDKQSVHLCRYEDFYTRGKVFDTIVASGGSASYIKPEAFGKLKHQLSEGGKFFLSFYAEAPLPHEKLQMDLATVYNESWKKFPEYHQAGPLVFVGGTRETLEGVDFTE